MSLDALPAVTVPITLRSRFDDTEGHIYLTGAQALIRILIDQARADAGAGRRTAGFVSGYPGSPLAGLDIEFGRQAKILDQHGIRHVSALNEDLAATALFGTQMVESRPNATVDGVFGMWYGKAPGVDRSGDAFRHANYRGTSRYGGVLAVAGDDPDAKSTIIPSDSTRAFEDFYMPVLFPGDVQDVVDLGLHGYAISRAAGLWCGFKIVTNVADSSGSVIVGVDRVRPLLPEVEFDGGSFSPTMRPNVGGKSMLPVEREIYYARLDVARQYGRLNGLNPVTVRTSGDQIGLIAPGRAYFDLRQSLHDLGFDDDALRAAGIRLMKIGLMSPLHEDDLRDFAAGLEEIIVVEDKRPHLEQAVKVALFGMTGAPKVLGKNDDMGRVLLPADGELTADIISRAIGPRLALRLRQPSIEARLAVLARERTLIPLKVERSAYFCSGCPHNRSLRVPDDSLVGAGIGCHLMALVADHDGFGEIAGYTHMGAEGTQWIGLAPYVETDHIFQNLGDGTFHHSGSLAIRFAVAAGCNITYKLLYNGAVGMTGGQEVQGALPIPDLTRLLAAEGVKQIIITSDDPDKYRGVELASIALVRHRDELLSAQSQLAAIAGVTVLIHDQQCAAERRRLRKRGKVSTPTTRLFVNHRVCEMCGDCGAQSNCLSLHKVSTEFGDKTTIHQSSCNLDRSCALGDCPSFITVDVSSVDEERRQHMVGDVPDEPPEPRTEARQGTTIQMVGIGGTGVVTVSQILATAATLDGMFVRDLDLTGSSQKAGPVVSQLQIAPNPQIGAAYFSLGGTDTYLVFDLLAGVTPANLERAARERTIAIVSTSAVPTGQMAAHAETEYPSVAELTSKLEAGTRADRNVYIDAMDLANRWFGDHMLGNMVLIGVAYQAGVLGVSATSIERAIDLNGVEVDRNIRAFRWGRWWLADPTRLPQVGRAVSVDEEKPIDQRIQRFGVSRELSRSIAIRFDDLTDYASASYADRYVADVAAVVDATRRAGVVVEDPIRVVAQQLHRLMAYKDEYEVARLHTDPALRHLVEDEFGRGARIAFQLHPPVLRSLGLNRKLVLGERAALGLRLLAKGKRLRQTPFDPFGYSQVRRVERGLIEHYRRLVSDAMRILDVDNVGQISDLLGLIDIVRGYESIKLRNLARYRHELQAAAAKLGIHPFFPAGANTSTADDR